MFKKQKALDVETSEADWPKFRDDLSYSYDIIVDRWTEDGTKVEKSRT